MGKLVVQCQTGPAATVYVSSSLEILNAVFESVCGWQLADKPQWMPLREAQ